MGKKDRKERRKHLQPELGTEKKDRQLISELDLVAPTENAEHTEELTGFAAFKAGYEEYRASRMTHAAKKRTRIRLLSLLAAVTIVFALIGVVATIQYSADMWHSITTKEAVKQELTPIIAPYVVTDVPEFTDVTLLSETVKQRLAVWQFLLYADISAYEQDDYGNLFVPTADLNVYAREMFGYNVTLNPRSDYAGSLAITFDEESGNYLLPLRPDYATYYPNITKIVKEKGGYLLQVQYMASDFLDNLKPQSSGTVIKTMEYHLTETDEGYRVDRVQLIAITADGYYQPDASDEVSSEAPVA